MNNERRKQINAIIYNLDSSMDYIKTNDVKKEKVMGFLDSIGDRIKDICNDEEFAYDNMPENLQCSLRGETMEECIEMLNDAIDLIEDIISGLEDNYSEGIEALGDSISEVTSLLDDVVNS